jgi:hypothetical protein
MPRRIGRVSKVFAAVALALTVLVVGIPDAFATCHPPRSLYGSPTTAPYGAHPMFDGLYDDGYPNVTTAAATEPAYVPYVDFTYDGADSIWPMLAGDNCEYGLAQVGQYEGHPINTGASPNDRVFYEVENCNSYLDGGPIVYTGSGANETHTFTVNHSASSGGVALLVDGTTIASATVNWTADQAQYAGETHQEDDQMFGGASNHELVSNVNMCVYGTSYSCFNPLVVGGWSNVPASQTESYFGKAVDTTNGRYATWDTACSS